MLLTISHSKRAWRVAARHLTSGGRGQKDFSCFQSCEHVERGTGLILTEFVIEVSLMIATLDIQVWYCTAWIFQGSGFLVGAIQECPNVVYYSL